MSTLREDSQKIEDEQEEQDGKNAEQSKEQEEHLAMRQRKRYSTVNEAHKWDGMLIQKLPCGFQSRSCISMLNACIFVSPANFRLL